MRASLRWLREFVDIPETDPDRVAHVLLMLGLEVESIDRYDPEFTGVEVGRVASIRAHPDADKIRLATVERASGSQEVVCGAWNFGEGDLIALAVEGAVLPGGFEIGAREIRGVVSNGMICSEKELHLGDDHDGILVLDESFNVGDDFAEVVGLPDVVFDIDVTSNRPDAMSIHGIARELSAFYRIPVRYPVHDLGPVGGASDVRVTIEAPDGCPRFVAQEMAEVTVAPSPFSVRQRLRLSGVRPISNAVDVTNYVMLELGQPLHAFDADRVAGQSITVRRATEGERLTTLDGVERILAEGDLLVTDAEGPSALGAVMGGAHSEVNDTTTRLIIEGAAWHAPTVLHTSKRLGLRSEASARFERGVDPNLPPSAVARAARLLMDWSGASPVGDAIDVYPVEVRPWTVELPKSEPERLLGVPFDEAMIIDYLGRFGLATEEGDPLVVTIPTYRPDLTRAADLVEEVARLHGYEKFPETVPVGPGGGLTQAQVAERRVRATMQGIGFNEAQVSTFVGPAEITMFGDPIDSAVRIVNPLREEEGYLRTSLLPGLLRGVAFNQGYGQGDVALYELGRVFRQDISPEFADLPDQPRRIAFAAVGNPRSSGLVSPDAPVDGHFAAGVIRTLFSHNLGGELEHAAELINVEGAGLHPGRGADVLISGRSVGQVGELHPRIARRIGIEGRVVVGEVDLAPFVSARVDHQFVDPSTQPPVIFDLAFELDQDTPGGCVTRALVEAGVEELESAVIFDEFSAGSLAESGRKSVAARVVLRGTKTTLSDEDTAPLRQRLIEEVESSCNARLRGT
ncbi:MAG: phenylalanine--tRNA ligase subunit beta [Acidimicrobiia bacterium]|nr:phenylalanine--tRNA ligase subunit beta [Acidimicrobiia bacterium]